MNDASDIAPRAATLVDWFVMRHDVRANGGTPFVLGISGLQGSGKTTLATRIAATARARGIDALDLSLDDVYLTRAQRAALARDVHPLLATRGVPGTHDIALLRATLAALADATPQTPAFVPRFDKGCDDRATRDTWTRVTRPPQLVVLEGWCLGVPPQSEAALDAPINALERDADADGLWRRYVNAALVRDYAPLWSRLDALVVLLAPSFDVVHRWRDEQEQALRDRGAPGAMSSAEVAGFVAHYERLSRHALDTLPARADHLLRLDASRRVIAAASTGARNTTGSGHP